MTMSMIIDFDNRLVFYYPMTAITTIFMHIVYNPLATSVSNDIALMDAVVGFFGRLEFITSGEAAFTRMGELVQQARCIVLRAQEDAAREQEPHHQSNVSQIETMTTTLSGNSITNEQAINRSSNEPRDVVTDEVDIHSTAHNRRGTGQDGPGHSDADRPRHELGGTPAVNTNVERAALTSNEDPSRADFVGLAEHLQQTLGDFTQPMTGLFPGSVLNADWLDAWMIPRQSGSTVFDQELQGWT
jgi:hypothetical protein